MKRTTSILAFFVFLLLPLFFSGSTYADNEEEYAIFPASIMDVNQIAFESASHGVQFAIDILPHGRVFAPFTGKVIYTNNSWGDVILQSESEVYWADGTFDYMTVEFMHDDYIDVKQGDIISQGTPFFDEGHACPPGKSVGIHVHIAVYRGRLDFQYANGNGYVNGNGDVFPFDALFISDRTTEVWEKGQKKNFNRVYNNAPENYSDKWRELHYISSCSSSRSSGKASIRNDTYIRSLPCSAKTNSASINVLHPKVGQVFSVTGTYSDSAGKTWYRVIFGDRYGFLYSGDVAYFIEDEERGICVTPEPFCRK